MNILGKGLVEGHYSYNGFIFQRSLAVASHQVTRLPKSKSASQLTARTGGFPEVLNW